MKKQFIYLFLIVISLLSTIGTYAQCAMCTAVADEAMKNGNTAGAGINKGVLYLFLAPYLIVGTIGFIWWRAKRKAQAEIALQS